MGDTDHLIARIPSGWFKGLSIDEGWYAIVLELDRQLAEIDPAYEIHQVKEKFGGLRYYCSLDFDERARSLIRAAEVQASITCEKCGSPGSLQGVNWLKTLCEGCVKP